MKTLKETALNVLLKKEDAGSEFRHSSVPKEDLTQLLKARDEARENLNKQKQKIKDWRKQNETDDEDSENELESHGKYENLVKERTRLMGVLYKAKHALHMKDPNKYADPEPVGPVA